MPSKYFFRQLWLTTGTFLNILNQTSIAGFTAILIPQLRDTHHGIDTYLESWLGSAHVLGSIVGSMMAPYIIDRFGRKFIHLFIHLPVIAGWLLIIIIESIDLMITMRFIQGISIGLRSPLSAIIIGECTAPKYRGAFITSISLSFSLGILFPHLFGIFFSWRLTAITSCVLNVVSFVILLYPPESPVWLSKKGRFDESLQAFYWYRGYGLETSKEVEVLLKRTKQKSTELNLLKVFQSTNFLKPFIIAIVSVIACDFSGSFVVSSYLLDIITKSFSSVISADKIMISFDCFRVLVSILNCYLIKRFNRRQVLHSSVFLTILPLTAISTYIYINKVYKLNFDIILVILLFSYAFGMDIGLTSLMFILIGEIFPTAYKEIGAGLTTMIGLLFLFLTLFAAPHCITLIGIEGTFLIFAVILFISWIYLYFNLPETKDKALYEIEDEIKVENIKELDCTKPMIKTFK